MDRALVLNASYQPICVVPARRAVVLVLKEKADVLVEGSKLVRGATLALNAPSVIRLRYFVKVPIRTRAALSRRAVFVRDDHTCQYCGKRGNDLTLDHVMPRHRGGQHTWDNVVAACRACNHRKGGRTLAESHMTLLRQPKRPPATPTYLYSSYVRAGERAWAKFIGMDETAAAS